MNFFLCLPCWMSLCDPTVSGIQIGCFDFSVFSLEPLNAHAFGIHWLFRSFCYSRFSRNILKMHSSFNPLIKDREWLSAKNKSHLRCWEWDFLFLIGFQFEEIKSSVKTILGKFSQYHLNTVDIEKNFAFYRIQYDTGCYVCTSFNNAFIFAFGFSSLILRLFPTNHLLTFNKTILQF